jgi:hypothetical protein
MSEQTTASGSTGSTQPVERGAAEEAAGAPLTPTEVQASQRPPSAPGNDPQDAGEDDGAGR